MILECLKKLVSHRDLDEDEAYQCMMEMISGQTNDVQTAALLTALAMKGETVEEITGFVKAMRNACLTVSSVGDAPLVDVCGTGGDIFKTFNVSTTAGIIAASCGVTIAKHGNRNITSKYGGANILEALGVDINCDAPGVESCLQKAGIGFMFAPNFHPSIKNVMPVRQELGIRTVFNILGPLTSPAHADIQLLGVFAPEYVELIAKVLQNLEVKRAMVVHGFDQADNPAMDEISTIGKTRVAVLENGEIELQELYPEDFGLKRANPKDIKALDSLQENLDVVNGVLKGKMESNEEQARLDLCLANAGAIIFISGEAKSLKEGVETARKAVLSGKALGKLDEFVKVSNGIEIY
jgi:anthranilate phosphoribosyltransferase